MDTIYLDFSKAFDCVPHRRLIGKLESYGVTGKILKWIKEFLNGHTQVVKVNGAESESAPVVSGIPQGSVLGQILFIIYINDPLENIESEGLYLQMTLNFLITLEHVQTLLPCSPI